MLRIRIRRIHMFLGLLDPNFASQRYGSGSFYYQLLIDFLFLKNDVNVPSKSIKQRNFFKIVFLLVSSRSIRIRSRSGSGSISQRHGSHWPIRNPLISPLFLWLADLCTAARGTASTSTRPPSWPAPPPAASQPGPSYTRHQHRQCCASGAQSTVPLTRGPPELVQHFPL